MGIGVHDCSVAHKEKPVLSRVGNLSSCQHLGGLRTASFFVEWAKTLKGLYEWTFSACCRN